MRPECSFTDYFVIAPAATRGRPRAIWDEVHTQLKQEERLSRAASTGCAREPGSSADYLDVVLHVFTPEARAYYRLEELWSDVPAVDVDAAAV